MTDLFGYNNFPYLYTIIQNLRIIRVKKSNEKMFCSPEMGTMIADEIGRHKLVRTLREDAHMGHTTIAKLKRGN